MTPYDALFGRQMKDLPALQTDERIDEATLDLFDLELPTDENSASTSGINIK
jgi:hypothetical protein